jgi:hypothetical protein
VLPATCAAVVGAASPSAAPRTTVRRSLAAWKIPSGADGCLGARHGAGGIPSTERNRLSGQWLATSWIETWLVVISALVAFCAIGLYTRMAGLHTFSKMSAYDFPATRDRVVAGDHRDHRRVVTDGLIGLATIYVAQMLVALLRRRASLHEVVDNDPVLLMLGGELLEEHLRRTDVTRGGIWAKLREAIVTRYAQVLAVVLETTRDVSVLSLNAPMGFVTAPPMRG